MHGPLPSVVFIPCEKSSSAVITRHEVRQKSRRADRRFSQRRHFLTSSFLDTRQRANNEQPSNFENVISNEVTATNAREVRQHFAALITRVFLHANRKVQIAVTGQSDATKYITQNTSTMCTTDGSRRHFVFSFTLMRTYIIR